MAGSCTRRFRSTGSSWNWTLRARSFAAYTRLRARSTSSPKSLSTTVTCTSDPSGTVSLDESRHKTETHQSRVHSQAKPRVVPEHSSPIVSLVNGKGALRLEASTEQAGRSFHICKVTKQIFWYPDKHLKRQDFFNIGWGIRASLSLVRLPSGFNILASFSRPFLSSWLLNFKGSL